MDNYEIRQRTCRSFARIRRLFKHGSGRCYRIVTNNYIYTFILNSEKVDGVKKESRYDSLLLNGTNICFVYFI